MSQQRTSALRRVRPNIRGVQFANLDWQFAAFDGNTIKFQLFQAGQNLLTTLDGCTLSEVPQIVQTSPPLAPVAASIDGMFLVIDYGVPQAAGITLYCGPNDPGFRGLFGEYLSMKELVLAAPAPPVDAVALSATVNGAGFDIALDGSGGQLYLQSLPPISNVTAGTLASVARVDGFNLYVEFPGAPASGDVIDWANIAGYFLNPSGGALGTFNLVSA